MTTRLLKTYDLLQNWGSTGDPPEGTQTLIISWEQIGLNINGLYGHLMEAARGREAYEAFRVEIASRKPDWKRETRRARRVIRGGRLFVELMRRSGAKCSELSRENLADAVEAWGNEYLRDLEATAAKKLEPGRPREEWLTKCVVHLAEQLRNVGQSWRRTTKIIHEAFRGVRMDDIATESKIRHVIRKERRERPQFGTAPGPRCEQCVGPSGIGKAMEDFAYVQARVGREGMRRLMRSPKTQQIIRRTNRRIRAILDRGKREWARVDRMTARRDALLQKAGELAREIRRLRERIVSEGVASEDGARVWPSTAPERRGPAPSRQRRLSSRKSRAGSGPRS